jgi:hypothetical protein
MAINVKQVTAVPEVVPGPARMQEFVHRAIELYKSDAIVPATSATGATNIIELPGNCVIVDAWVHVTTAFDASGTSAAATATLIMPNDTGTEVVWDADLVDLQSSGKKPATGNMGIEVPSSGGFVAVTFEPGTTTAGQFEVYVELAHFADRLGP